jgi:hypothetical protein
LKSLPETEGFFCFQSAKGALNYKKYTQSQFPGILSRFSGIKGGNLYSPDLLP